MAANTLSKTQSEVWHKTLNLRFDAWTDGNQHWYIPAAKHPDSSVRCITVERARQIAEQEVKNGVG